MENYHVAISVNRHARHLAKLVCSFLGGPVWHWEKVTRLQCLALPFIVICNEEKKFTTISIARLQRVLFEEVN